MLAFRHGGVGALVEDVGYPEAGADGRLAHANAWLGDNTPRGDAVRSVRLLCAAVDFSHAAAHILVDGSQRLSVRDSLLEEFGGITPERCVEEVTRLLLELRELDLVSIS